MDFATLPEHLQEGRTAEEVLELERADAVAYLEQVRTFLADLALELAVDAGGEVPLDAETVLRRIGALASAQLALDDLVRTFGKSDREHVESFDALTARIEQERQQ